MARIGISGITNSVGGFCSKVTPAADGALGLVERDRVLPKWEQTVVEAGAPFTSILLFEAALTAVVEGGAGYLVELLQEAAIVRD